MLAIFWYFKEKGIAIADVGWVGWVDGKTLLEGLAIAYGGSHIEAMMGDILE
ncbi:MAG: hypothetical protein J7647_12965 [Cyanobacteria bacterium SBLK]|nr:hypothetical protein [Cyanobacteria bacterium SBLK]